MKLVRRIGAALLLSAPLLVVLGAPGGAQVTGCEPEAISISSGTLFTPGNGDSQTDWVSVDWPAGTVISSTIDVADPGHLTARDANEPQINETVAIRFGLAGGGIANTPVTPDLPIELTEAGPYSFTITAPADIVRVRISHGWYVNDLQGDLTNSIQADAEISCVAEQVTTTTSEETTTTTEATTTTGDTTTTEVTTTTPPPPPTITSTTTVEPSTTTSTTIEQTIVTEPPQQPTTTAPPGTGGGELPRTGPNDGIIRVGLLLALAGAALLLVERVGFGEPAMVRADLED